MLVSLNLECDWRDGSVQFPWEPPGAPIRRTSSRPRADKSQGKAKRCGHAHGYGGQGRACKEVLMVFVAIALARVRRQEVAQSN